MSESLHMKKKRKPYNVLGETGHGGWGQMGKWLLKLGWKLGWNGYVVVLNLTWDTPNLSYELCHLLIAPRCCIRTNHL